MISLPFILNPAEAEDAAAQLERDITHIVREETGMHEGIASMFSQALVRGLRRRLGGKELYIPVPDRLAERDAAIRREFNGRNREELMRRHRIGRSQFYEITRTRPSKAHEGLVPNANSPVVSGENRTVGKIG